MVLSKRLRRVVAGISGVVFLLCHSVGVAHGYSTILRAPEKASMPMPPCHEMTGDESGEPSKSAGSSCHDVASFLADQPIPGWSKVYVVAVVDSSSTSLSTVPPYQPPSLRVKPPPLSILHCCLRN